MPKVKKVWRRMYKESVKFREKTILDIAAAAASIGSLISDEIDFQQITPQMKEAFHLAYPHQDIHDLTELSGNEVTGFINGWKGKYFEVLVRDRLNNGQVVGDLALQPGQVAKLAESPVQKGWDLQILTEDGQVHDALQLKATNSVGYIREALENYPDIKILATDEVADNMTEILSAGIEDNDIESIITQPVEDLLDTPLEEFAENVLPGLPFIIILSGSTHAYIVGRVSFTEAFINFLERSSKTAAAIGAGMLTYAVFDLGIISIPTTILTRIGLDYLIEMNKYNQNFPKRIERMHRMLSEG